MIAMRCSVANRAAFCIRLRRLAADCRELRIPLHSNCTHFLIYPPYYSVSMRAAAKRDAISKRNPLLIHHALRTVKLWFGFSGGFSCSWCFCAILPVKFTDLLAVDGRRPLRSWAGWRLGGCRAPVAGDLESCLAEAIHQMLDELRIPSFSKLLLRSCGESSCSKSKCRGPLGAASTLSQKTGRRSTLAGVNGELQDLAPVLRLKNSGNDDQALA